MNTNDLLVNMVKGTTGLLILMLMISGGYIGQLLPCETQKLFTENMYMKHLIGLFSVIFFVSSSGIINYHNKLTPNQTIAFSVLLYGLFMLSNKSGVHANMVLFAALITITLLEMYVQHYQEELGNGEKKKTSEEEQELHIRINFFTRLQHRVLLGTLVIVLVGFLLYGYDKYKEYGNEFSVLKFIVGTPQCKGLQ